MAALVSLVRRSVVTGAALAFWLLPADARGQVSVEVFGGTAYSVPTPLTIEQTGYPSITLTAHYSVRPLADIPYYAVRIGLWGKDGGKNDVKGTGWVLELLHHKLYLDNPPPEVHSFEVTHGYNIITLNRGWRRDRFVFLAGGGVLTPHTNSLIRGKERPITAPYTLAGVGVQGAVGRRLELTPWLFASVEGKITAAWARVPVADGHATVPNVAFHGLVGIGAQF